MVDPRNIQFEIIDDLDSPFQLEFNPKNSIPRIFKSQNVIELYNKLKSRQRMGFIVGFDLIWEKPVFFDEAQYNQLYGLFLEEPSFYIYPNPSAEPDMKFLVDYDTDFDFESAVGFLDGWGWFGTIKLFGAELLQRGDLPVSFNFYEYD